MKGLPREYLQLGAHLIVSIVFMVCLMSQVDRLVIIAITSLTGALVHTVADTAVHPERGGDRLNWTLVSNLLFTVVMTTPLVFLLPRL